MRDSYQTMQNSQLAREARIGFLVISVLSALLIYVAWYRLSGHFDRLPDDVLNAPIAKQIPNDHRQREPRLAPELSSVSSFSPALPNSENQSGSFIPQSNQGSTAEVGWVVNSITNRKVREPVAQLIQAFAPKEGKTREAKKTSTPQPPIRISDASPLQKVHSWNPKPKTSPSFQPKGLTSTRQPKTFQGGLKSPPPAKVATETGSFVSQPKFKPLAAPPVTLRPFGPALNKEVTAKPESKTFSSKKVNSGPTSTFPLPKPTTIVYPGPEPVLPKPLLTEPVISTPLTSKPASSKPAPSQPVLANPVQVEPQPAPAFNPASPLKPQSKFNPLPRRKSSPGLKQTPRKAFESPQAVPAPQMESPKSISLPPKPDRHTAVKSSSTQKIKQVSFSTESKYETKAGDSFWSIAQDEYEDGRFFRALYEANRRRLTSYGDPQPGTKIEIPSRQDLLSRYPDLCPVDVVESQADKIQRSEAELNKIIKQRNQALNQRLYETRAGDTLFDIARQKLAQASRYVEIIELNRTRLQPGTNQLTPLPAGVQLILPPSR